MILRIYNLYRYMMPGKYYISITLHLLYVHLTIMSVLRANKFTKHSLCTTNYLYLVVMKIN